MICLCGKAKAGPVLDTVLPRMLGQHTLLPSMRTMMRRKNFQRKVVQAHCSFLYGAADEDEARFSTSNDPGLVQGINDFIGWSPRKNHQVPRESVTHTKMRHQLPHQLAEHKNEASVAPSVGRTQK